MFQIVFQLPFFHWPIYSYGMMLVIAFLACIYVSKHMAGRIGLDGELFVNLTLIALVAGVAGARMSHVLENFRTYTNPERSFFENVLDAVNIRSGGLTYYGGFLLATPACIGYILFKKLPLLKCLDIVAPVVMIGLGFGRIGCYLNGCCYGALCNPTFAASFTQFPYGSNAYVTQFEAGQIQPPPPLLNVTPTGLALKDWNQIRAEGLTDLADRQHALPVQPTQLYSSFTAFLLAALLWSYWTTAHTDGCVFALMLLLEGPARFILELIRVEPPVWRSFSLSMILGVAFFVAGCVLFLALRLRKPGENREIFAPAH